MVIPNTLYAQISHDIWALILTIFIIEFKKDHTFIQRSANGDSFLYISEFDLRDFVNIKTHYVSKIAKYFST